MKDDSDVFSIFCLHYARVVTGVGEEDSLCYKYVANSSRPI